MTNCTVHNPCLGCRSGFHNECDTFWVEDTTECGCGGAVVFTATGEVKSNKEESSDSVGNDSGYVADGYEGTKDLESYKDPLSTGRKRAAAMYPIATGQVCEWAGLARAGGGIIPIVGCVGRAASDRHHGPDKNTMNNAPDNVHRICDHCHNTWHALNDPGYGERPDHTKPFIPRGEVGVDWFMHDNKSRATTEQILEAEAKRLEDSK